VSKINLFDYIENDEKIQVGGVGIPMQNRLKKLRRECTKSMDFLRPTKDTSQTSGPIELKFLGGQGEILKRGAIKLTNIIRNENALKQKTK